MEDISKFLLDELRAVRLENVALQNLCTLLLYEVAMLHSLQSHALKIGEIANEPAYTAVINKVCRIAEGALPPHQPKDAM